MGIFFPSETRNPIEEEDHPSDSMLTGVEHDGHCIFDWLSFNFWISSLEMFPNL